jgi:sodium-dependent dicarboxylate transporter 2/3/5
MRYLKNSKLLAGPIVALLIFSFANLVPANPMVTKMAGIAAWMAIWWLTEAVELAVTALLPIIFFPMLGIVDSKTTAAQYMDPIIFLFIGGFIIAFAIEKWNLHQRIALKILMMVGSSPAKIIFGVMVTAFLLSMWVSNTATVMMLISAVLAIIVQIENHYKEEQRSNKIASALLIGLAYAASIGGMATLVGTPTNMIFLREYSEKFANYAPITFLSWFKIAFPVSLCLFVLTFFVIKFLFVKKSTGKKLEKDFFKNAYTRLGKMNYEEKAVALVFIITALLWFTRSNLNFGFIEIKGWSNLFANKEYITDSTVAIFMAVMLFIIPSKTEKGAALILWKDVVKLPFDIVLLFGGGFALAKGFELSGLSAWLGSQLQFASHFNLYFLVFITCVIVTIISEFASNVACIQLMLPVLIVIQQTINIHPLFLLLPATLASSLGFMLPVATAPNTIVFGSKKIIVNDMLKAGFFVNLFGIVLITLASYFIAVIFN